MASDSQRWSPFQELDQFKRDFDGLLDRFLGNRPSRGGNDTCPIPAVESYMAGGRLVIRADLPGVDPKDVEITATGNQLTIRGTRERLADETQDEFHYREIRYGPFERVIPMPEGVSAESIKAFYRNGVLELSVQVPDQPNRRKVPITVKA